MSALLPASQKALLAQLLARARVWLPEWQPQRGGDVAQALLEISARLDAEVAQRLERMPEKARRGFVHWLGSAGRGATPARLALVFELTPGAAPVEAPAGVQLQAQLDAGPQLLETQAALTLFASRLALLVAADPDGDRFHFAPAAVLASAAARAQASQWLVTPLSPPAGQPCLQAQVAQPAGLEAGLLVLDDEGAQHEVRAVDKGIASFDEAAPLPLPPQPGGELLLRRASVFDAFGPGQINRQEHVLYLGDDQLLALQAPAVITVQGLPATAAQARWDFWGTGDAAGKQPPAWQRLDPVPAADGTLALSKGPGRLAPREIAGRSSHWLRARVAPGTQQQPSHAQGIGLCIEADQETGAEASRQLALEGFANTTPLVLDQSFHPLGHQPRLMDAFYLGCAEAFSKPGADVRLSLDMGDRISSPLAAARLPDSAAHVVVAVSQVGALRCIVVPDAAPPQFLPATQPQDERGRAVALAPSIRPGVAVHGKLAHASAVARDGGAVWLYVADSDPPWRLLGRPSVGPCTNTLLLHSADGTTLIAEALAGERLWRRDALRPSAWQEDMPLQALPGPPKLRRWVPVLQPGQDAGNHAETDRFVGVTAQGRVLTRDSRGWHVSPLPEAPAPPYLDPDMYPLAMLLDDGRVMVVSAQGRAPDGTAPAAPALVALTMRGEAPATHFSLPLVAPVLGNALAPMEKAGPSQQRGVLFATRAQEEAPPEVWSWRPLDDFTEHPDTPPPQQPSMDGAPVQLGQAYFAPAVGGSVLLRSVDATFVQHVENARVAEAVLLDATPSLGSAAALLLDRDPHKHGEALAGRPLVQVQALVALPASKQQVALLQAWRHDTPGRAGLYRTLPLPAGGKARTVKNKKQLLLQADPAPVGVGDVILLEGARSPRLFRIKKKGPPPVEEGSPYEEEGVPTLLTLDGEIPSDAVVDGRVSYRFLERLHQQAWDARPALDVHALSERILARLSTASLSVEAQQPASQRLLALLPAMAGESAVWAVLRLPWKPLPQDEVRSVSFTADASTPRWTPFAPAARNPELSWEYWNGHGWWQLKPPLDETGHLLRSGRIEFTVPDDLQPTEVAGRRNHWVRARLVGGDYGPSTPVVESSVELDLATGKPVRATQKVLPAVGPSAPQVVALALSYGLKRAVPPRHVLAADGAGVSDLGEANRTAGATVSHFVPLRSQLDALRAPAAEAAAGGQADDAASYSAGRALYLCFEAPLQDGVVSLLCLVEERSQEGAQPLQVELLRRGRFESAAAVEDGTCGLGESGTLVFWLSGATQPARLFGREGHWIRLRPQPAFNAAAWQPCLRGVWLNGAWATAAQTHALELLGSSDGSPGQRVQLAHAPVVAGSLRLRVRERLADEELQALQRTQPDAVALQLSPRPGPWVLWHEVDDIDDALPGERAYALDEERGVIVFGDGRSGRIPPLGADAFLAESYREGGGAAANALPPFSDVNLVTPLQGVTRTFAPEGAAGGSDAPDVATVLRFAPAQLYGRDRALTLGDLEQLALQFDAGIARARALTQAGGRTVLLVVMRGREPRPAQALRRALRAFLLARALPQLGATGMLDIAAPLLVPLRVTLELGVASLSDAGPVGAVVLQRLQALLDPGDGGLDHLGWPPGRAPGVDELATALADVPGLQALLDVRLEQLLPDGRVGALPSLGPLHLARLAAEDGLRCVFRTDAAEGRA